MIEGLRTGAIAADEFFKALNGQDASAFAQMADDSVEKSAEMEEAMNRAYEATTKALVDNDFQKSKNNGFIDELERINVAFKDMGINGMLYEFGRLQEQYQQGILDDEKNSFIWEFAQGLITAESFA